MRNAAGGFEDVNLQAFDETTTENNDINADINTENTQKYISTDTVSEYLDSIKDFDLLTPAEEKHYAELVRQGDKAAREHFIKHNTKLVFFAAKKRAMVSPLEFEDLIQAGNEGLIHAIDKYNPKKARFSTYAMYWILAYMKRTEENLVRPIRLPAYLVQINNKINRAKEKLKLDLEREPNVEELMNETGCSEKHIRLALETNYHVCSLNLEFGDEKENEGITFFSSKDDVEDTAISNLTNAIIKKEVHTIIRNNLTQMEQRVIYMRWFGNFTFEKVSKKLGISKNKVKEIEENALSIIKKCSIQKGLQRMVQ